MEEGRTIEDAMKERRALRTLRESEGWAILMDIAQGQIGARAPTVLGPTSAEQIYAVEFQKGEMAGIGLFQQMPDNAIDGLDQEIDTFKRTLGITEDDDEQISNERPAP